MVEAIHFFKTEVDRTREILAGTLAPLIGISDEEDVAHLQRALAELLSPKPYPIL